jgi:hypothetical protein
MQLKSVSISKMLSEVVMLQTRGRSGIRIRVPLILWFTSQVRVSALFYEVAETLGHQTLVMYPIRQGSTRDHCVTLMILHCSHSRRAT